MISPKNIITSKTPLLTPHDSSTQPVSCVDTRPGLISCKIVTSDSDHFYPPPVLLGNRQSVAGGLALSARETPPKSASLVSPPASAMTGNYGTPPRPDRSPPKSRPPTPRSTPARGGMAGALATEGPVSDVGASSSSGQPDLTVPAPADPAAPVGDALMRALAKQQHLHVHTVP